MHTTATLITVSLIGIGMDTTKHTRTHCIYYVIIIVLFMMIADSAVESILSGYVGNNSTSSY